MGANATADDVARLFGRAAFGATQNDLTVWTGKNYDDMVDALVNASITPASQSDDARRSSLASNENNLRGAQRWWLQRMASTTQPLLERMTYFWHTHIPNAYLADPDVGELITQNQTMRQHALGDFRALMYALTIDASMLVYLSGQNNRRNAINENYARELFELFTMGAIPQRYTETDIRQAAKALSGWLVNATARQGTFNKDRHDTSKKTIFGTTIGGYLSGSPQEALEFREVVDVTLAQPVVSRFLAYKLATSFAYVPTTRDLLTNPDQLIVDVGNALKPDGAAGIWNIATAMKVLLKHPSFRYNDAPAGNAIVRSPIELCVHLAKILGVNLDPPAGLTDTNAYNANQGIYALTRMGQLPFQPPNVGGWPKGTAWLTGMTVKARYDLVNYLMIAYALQSKQKTNPLPPSGDLAAWTSFVGLGHLSPLTQQVVQSYLADPGTTTESAKQQSVLYLLVSSPDWQVM